MSFDWSNYLMLAQHLKDEADQLSSKDACFAEACYRSVVSRAYYGVYCQARNFARDIDKHESHSNEHQNLQDFFKKHPYKVRKAIGNWLAQLHQHRKEADYDDRLRESPVNKAILALTLAAKIQKNLEQLKPKRR